MLVLSRKIGESIVIGGGIAVTLVAVNGNVVRLGFEAPKDIPIYRSEILKKMRESVPRFPVLEH